MASPFIVVCCQSFTMTRCQSFKNDDQGHEPREKVTSSKAEDLVYVSSKAEVLVFVSSNMQHAACAQGPGWGLPYVESVCCGMRAAAARICLIYELRLLNNK